MITGSTYASDSGDPHLPISPQSKSFNIGNPTSASNSIRSDVTYAHAQSSATATVGPTGLTKSTSGRAWLDTTPILPDTSLFNSRGDIWNASASGTQLIVNGPSGNTAPFNFFIPGTTLVPTVQFPPNTLPTDPVLTMQPRGPLPGQQGFFSDNGNPTTGNPTSLPSFFTEYFQLDASIKLVGAPNFLMQFHGNLAFNPGDNSVIGTGDFASLAASAIKTENTNETGPTYSLNLPDFTIPVGIPTNSPFDAIINMKMSMGDPNFSFDGNNPAATLPPTLPADTTTLPNNVGPIGAGGSFVVELNLTDLSRGYSLQVVPEPSSLALAALGGLGLILALRRRLCSN